METTLLSTKGQIVVPKAIRDSKGWKPGTEFTVEATPEGLLVRPRRQIKRTTLADLRRVAAKHKWTGKPLTLKDMDDAIAAAVMERHARGRY